MGQRRLRTGFEAYSALCQCETRGRDSMEYETTNANVFWILSLYYTACYERVVKLGRSVSFRWCMSKMSERVFK